MSAISTTSQHTHTHSGILSGSFSPSSSAALCVWQETRLEEREYYTGMERERNRGREREDERRKRKGSTGECIRKTWKERYGRGRESDGRERLRKKGIPENERGWKSDREEKWKTGWGKDSQINASLLCLINKEHTHTHWAITPYYRKKNTQRERRRKQRPNRWICKWMDGWMFGQMEHQSLQCVGERKAWLCPRCLHMGGGRVLQYEGDKEQTEER